MIGAETIPLLDQGSIQFILFGVMVLAVLFPVVVALTGHAGWEIAVTSALAVLVLVRHLPNLRRLVRGQELRTDGAGS